MIFYIIILHEIINDKNNCAENAFCHRTLDKVN